MGPWHCGICRKDTHSTLNCPDLPIVRLGRTEAPIVGFRVWKTPPRNGPFRLRSIHKDMAWNTRSVTTAQCDLRSKHTAPAMRCTCGLYASYSLRQAAAQGFGESTVVGAVLGWGRVYLHEDGWRAQHARVLCLTSIGAVREEDRAIAAAAGRPLIPSSVIETYACEFGLDGSRIYETNNVDQ